MDFTKITVTQLRRYLLEHKVKPITGLKAALIKRCQRHQTNCKCRLSDTTEPEISSNTDEYIDDIIKTIRWSASLKDFPALNHSCIHAFKASDKHIKQGYNLFQCEKVENMLVGMSDSDYYCKGRVSPSMKKDRYTVLVKIRSSAVAMSDCTCPAGKGRCKHAVALLYALVHHIMAGSDEIPESLACTSQPRQWGRVSARPVVADIANFAELAPRTVCHDPDNPSRADTQRERATNQLRYSSLPQNTAGELHITRISTLVKNHPFWESLISEKDVPNSSSAVQVTKKQKNR